MSDNTNRIAHQYYAPAPRRPTELPTELTHASRPENVIMPFGKYKGKQLGQILADDPLYLDWLVGAEIRSERLAFAVAEMCKKYEPEIERAMGGQDRRRHFDAGEVTPDQMGRKTP